MHGGKVISYVIIVSTVLFLFRWAVFPSNAYGPRDSEPVSRIVLPYHAKVQVTVNNAITNYCDGNFGVYTPTEKQLWADYNRKRGETVIIGPFDADTELIFYIEPKGFCSGHRYLSTNASHARIYEIAQGIWRIEWEDLPDDWPPDNDFDDLIVVIRLVGAYPDFKQDDGDWKEDIYDHNRLPEDTIERWGCALTAIANLLAYYGARDMDPGSLNKWMKENHGFDSRGGVYWASVSAYTPPESRVTVMEWEKNISRNDPTFYEEIASYLRNGWPVILDYRMPRSPSGRHFVVAVKQISEGGKAYYVVRDPSTASELTKIEVTDQNIRRAIFYRPSDGIIRPDVIVHGLSPIELLLIDNQGRRLGYDPLTGQELREIRHTDYAHNIPFWDPHGKGKNIGENVALEIPNAAGGDYRLLVYGTGSGSYQVETYYRPNQTISTISVISGTTQAGMVTLYNMHLSNQGEVNVRQGWTLQVSTASEHVREGGETRIHIRLVDAHRTPIPDVPVHLRASLGSIDERVTTDEEGEASALFHAGHASGVANVTAQVGDLGTHIRIAIYQRDRMVVTLIKTILMFIFLLIVVASSLLTVPVDAMLLASRQPMVLTPMLWGEYKAAFMTWYWLRASLSGMAIGIIIIVLVGYVMFRFRNRVRDIEFGEKE